jgi:hypothetical protein
LSYKKRIYRAAVSQKLKNTALGYVLRGSDQRARASMRVQEIGDFVSYMTATG